MNMITKIKLIKNYYHQKVVKNLIINLNLMNKNKNNKVHKKKNYKIIKKIKWKINMKNLCHLNKFKKSHQYKIIKKNNNLINIIKMMKIIIIKNIINKINNKIKINFFIIIFNKNYLIFQQLNFLK